LVFYAAPGVLGRFAEAAWFVGGTGMVLHYILALAGFAIMTWNFVEIVCLRGITGPNRYGADSLAR
jgi:uncharacterized membrane protein YhaH (DUF805 family)